MLLPVVCVISFSLMLSIPLDDCITAYPSPLPLIDIWVVLVSDHYTSCYYELFFDMSSGRKKMSVCVCVCRIAGS